VYAFILVITITLQAAGSEPRTFGLVSDDRYSPNACDKQAQIAAERMKFVLSQRFAGSTVEIQPDCVLLETRKI
jgi:hypothetical protein